MASEADQGERTEEATQQRREDFRKRGQVAQTRELAPVLLLFCSVLIVWLMSQFLFRQIFEIFQYSLGDSLAGAVRQGDAVTALKVATTRMAFIIVPIAGVYWVVGFAASLLQIGFLYNEEALQIRWDRLDPIQGFKKVFSLRAVVEGIKAVLKVTVILGIAYLLLKNQIQTLPHLMSFSISQIFVFLGELIVRLMSGVGFFMLTLAGIDYLYQRWDLESEMRMTKQEVKEEVKSREGDPLIRARIKRVQRDIASRRMMEDVPKADVVVTNPTHIAVALKYDENMISPKVLAKGAELIAQKIKDIARENNIPIVENKPLARTIFKTLKVGQMIPRELYAAVAEVLSYVYRLKKKKVK